MKTQLFLSLFLLLPIDYGRAQSNHLTEPRFNESEHREVLAPFMAGDKVWIFGDKVNVRKAPNLQSDVVSQLLIGDQVAVLDTAGMDRISGLSAYWYHIRYNEGKTPQTGYIWGGLIAGSRFQIGDIQILCGANFGKISDTDKTESINVVFRAAKNGQLLSSVTFEDISWVDGPSMQSWQIPNLGLTRFVGGVKTWVGYEACGYPQHEMYIFWDGAHLVKLPMLISISDAGAFSYEESYIFPSADEDQEAQKVYLRVVNMEMIEESEDYNEFDERTKQRQLKWNGREFVKPDFGNN